jgi:hypothetical protein
MNDGAVLLEWHTPSRTDDGDRICMHKLKRVGVNQRLLGNN